MAVRSAPSVGLALLVGEDAASEFHGFCAALLAEAHARHRNPIDGCGAWVDRDNKLLMAAGEFLVACGLVRREVAGPRGRSFIITDLGYSAYERLEKSWQSGT